MNEIEHHNKEKIHFIIPNLKNNQSISKINVKNVKRKQENLKNKRKNKETKRKNINKSCSINVNVY